MKEICEEVGKLFSNPLSCPPPTSLGGNEETTHGETFPQVPFLPYSLHS